MEIIAHRGASSIAPENSILAVEEALQLNVHSIEIDCQLSRDNQVVVFHDETLQRIRGGELLCLRDVDYHELYQYDIGNNQHIPLLEDVLRSVQGRCNLIIESKAEGTVQEIIKILYTFSYFHNIAIASSYIPEIIVARQGISNIPVSYIIKNIDKDLNDLSSYYNIREFNIAKEIATDDWIKNAKSQGFLLRVFTVNEKTEADRFDALGIDAIFTDYPQLFLPSKEIFAENQVQLTS